MLQGQKLCEGHGILVRTPQTELRQRHADTPYTSSHSGHVTGVELNERPLRNPHPAVDKPSLEISPVPSASGGDPQAFLEEAVVQPGKQGACVHRPPPTVSTQD